jgi:hypothetical protein
VPCLLHVTPVAPLRAAAAAAVASLPHVQGDVDRLASSLRALKESESAALSSSEIDRSGASGAPAAASQLRAFVAQCTSLAEAATELGSAILARLEADIAALMTAPLSESSADPEKDPVGLAAQVGTSRPWQRVILLLCAVPPASTAYLNHHGLCRRRLLHSQLRRQSTAPTLVPSRTEAAVTVAVMVYRPLRDKCACRHC